VPPVSRRNVRRRIRRTGAHHKRQHHPNQQQAGSNGYAASGRKAGRKSPATLLSIAEVTGRTVTAGYDSRATLVPAPDVVNGSLGRRTAFC